MARFRRFASPQFDWRRTPEHDSPGISADHYTAPLENGDSLHAYRLDTYGEREIWMHELRPHDLPMRFPIPRNPFDENSEWNVKVNKPGFNRRHQQYFVDGMPAMDKETAMERAEQSYRDNAPSWGPRTPHQREDMAFDYDEHFKKDDLNDDFGDIFGDKS